ncbi:MAG: helix-turn-helix domain-containing protein, partial [Elusimicrobiota bacterium]
PEQRLCRLEGKDIPLARIEFDLLVHFLRQRERVLTRGALLQSIWGDKPSSDMRTVDKHVEILRKKLGAFGRRLSTVFRVGYVLR